MADRRARPLIFAHRGASAAAPENTIEAFTLARELGADGVELDARRTADGHVVVHHDAHLPDGRLIVELPAAALPPSVAHLGEALDACTGMVVNVEIKNWPADADFDPTEAVAEAVVGLVARAGWVDDVLVSSFHGPTVERVAALDTRLATALLVARADLAAAVEVAAAAGHTAVHPWDPLVTAEEVAAAHDRGLAVNVWTVDDPERIRELAGWGVDGVVTNVPDVARRALDGQL